MRRFVVLVRVGGATCPTTLEEKMGRRGVLSPAVVCEVTNVRDLIDASNGRAQRFPRITALRGTMPMLEAAMAKRS